jgi:hypothetical protein
LSIMADPGDLTPSWFNFHNLVGVEVQANRGEDAAFFAAEYAHHRVEALPAGLPVVVVRFQRRSGLKNLPPGFTPHQHKLLARWGYRLSLEAERIQLEVMGNRLAAPMIHHMLLHPSLRYLCAGQGTLLLHAGAVSCGGKSLIFTGRGGAGKTTTSALMLAAGGQSWSPHADDYVFLAPGPRSLAYLTRAHLYSDLLRRVPEVAGRLSPAERIRLEFFSAVRRLTRDGLKWAVRMPLERLWPQRKLAASAAPAAILLLERGEDGPHPILRRLPASQAPLDELVEMNFYEARHFLHLVQKAGAIPDFPIWLERWKASERTLLEQRLQEIPVYRLELPAIRNGQASRRELFESLAALAAG